MLHRVGGVGVGRPLGGKGQRSLSHGLGDGLIPAGECIAHACDRGCRNGFAIDASGGRSAHAAIGVPRDLMGVVEEGQLIGNTVRDTLLGLAVHLYRHGLTIQHGDIRTRRVFQLHTCLPCHGQHQLHLLAAGSIFEGHLRLIAHLHGGDLPVSKQYRQEIDRRKLHSRIVLINEPRLHVITVQRQLRDLLSFDQQLFVGRYHSTCHVLLQCGDGRICNSGHKGVVKALILTLIFTPLVAVHLLIVAPGNTELFTGEVISHGYQQIQIAAPLGCNGQIPIRHGSGDLPIPAVKAIASFLRSFRRSNGITIVFLLRMIYLARLVNNEFQRVRDMLPLCFQRHDAAGLRRQVADSLAVRIGGIAQLPPREAPARPGKAVGCESLLLVISEALVSHAALAAVGVERHRVCVGAEAAGDGHIVVRHGKFAVHRLCTTHRPTAERIAGLGRISLHRHSRTVIDGRLSLYHAVQHVCQTVLMNLGGCRKGQVPRGHLFGRSRAPRRHIVACLRVDIGGNLRAVGHALGLHRLAVHLIGDGIGVDAPVRRQGLIARNSHGIAALHLRLAIKPTLKRIALLRRSGQSRILAAIGNGDVLACAAAVGVKRHRVLVDRPLRRNGHIPRGHGLGNLLIPTGEGVASLGGVCGFGDSRAVVLRNSLVDRLTVLERNRVLVDLPLRLDGHVLRRHSSGNLLAPTGEGVPLLGGVCGRGDGRAVVLRDGRDRAAAGRVERDRVLVDLPLRLDGQVLGGHGLGNLLIPTGESIARLGGVRRCGDGRAIVLRNGRNIAAAGRVEGDGVLVDLPLRRDGHILGGHGLGNLLIPTGESIARLGRILRRDDSRAVVLRNGRDRRTAIRIETHRVAIDTPLRHKGHGRTDFRRQIFDSRLIAVGSGTQLPSSEVIPGSCKTVLRQLLLRVIGEAHGFHGTRAAVGVKRHRVLIRRPLRRDGHILRGHGGGNIFIPTGEGVASLGGVCGLGDGRAVVLRDSLVDRLTVLERHRVLVDRPLRLDGHILRGHGGGNGLIPTGESIARLGRILRRDDSRAVVLCNNSFLIPVGGIKRHRILIDRPLRLDGHTPCGHGGGDLLAPPRKGIPRLGRSLRRGDLRAVVLRNGLDHAAAVRVEGDGVLVDLPLRRDGHILGGHGLGNLLIPTGESIARLGRILRRDDSRAVVLRNGRNLAAAVRVERDRVLVCRPVGGIFPVSGGIFDGDSLFRPTDVRAAPADEGIALLGGVLEGNVALHRVAVGIVLDRAAVQVIGNAVVDHLPLRRDGQVVGGHSHAVCILVPLGEGIPRLGGILAGLVDVRAELDGAGGIAGGVLFSAVHIPRQRVAVAGVINLHHRAAVGCDGGLGDRPGSKASLIFDDSHGLLASGAGHGNSLHIISACQRLIVMLHRVVGVGVGRPPGGQSQIFAGHDLGYKLRFAVVPPGEGIAGLGGGGEGNSLTGEGRDRITALKGQCHLTTPLAPHKLVNRHRVASCNAVGLHGIAWQRPCFRADGTILGSCLHLRQRITHHDTGRQRIADQIVRVTVGGAAGEALVQLGIRPCGDYTAAGGLRNAAKGSVDIQRTVDEQAAALTEAVSRQHAGRRIGLAAFIRLLPAIRYLQTSGHIQRSILRHSHRCTGHDAV